MDEELVIEANRRMKRTIRFGNILTVITLVIEVILLVVMNLYIEDNILKVSLIATVGMTSLFIIMAVALWKQSSVFNVSMSLLRYIERNYPDVKLPSYKEDEK